MEVSFEDDRQAEEILELVRYANVEAQKPLVEDELLFIAKYPEIAMRVGLECVVFVHILVDESGKPAKVKIAKPCGNVGFNEAAEEAAWKCTFTPGKQNEKPIRVWVSTILLSSGVSGPGFSRMASGMPTLPISCSGENRNWCRI